MLLIAFQGSSWLSQLRASQQPPLPLSLKQSPLPKTKTIIKLVLNNMKKLKKKCPIKVLVRGLNSRVLGVGVTPDLKHKCMVMGHLKCLESFQVGIRKRFLPVLKISISTDISVLGFYEYIRDISVDIFT